MNKINGGSAFPRTGLYATDAYEDGMSLRDYFAAAALASALRDYDIQHVDLRVIAETCYGLADAMVKAREA